MRYLLLFVATVLAPGLARAGAAADCPTALTAADDSFRETLARLDAAAKAGKAEICAAIDHHIAVMTAARAVFDRCLSGHDRSENVGQMDGSIADFTDIRARQGCP